LPCYGPLARSSASALLRHRRHRPINSVIPFALSLGRPERRRGHRRISNAMTVMFTALIAFLFYGERIALGGSSAWVAGFRGRGDSGERDGASVWPAALAAPPRLFCMASASTWCAVISPVTPPRGGAAALVRAACCCPAGDLPLAEHAIAAGSWVERHPARRSVHGMAFVIYYRLVAASVPAHLHHDLPDTLFG